MSATLNAAFAALSARTNLPKSRLASNPVATHWAPLISIGGPAEPLRVGIGPDEHGSVVWMIEGKDELYPLSTGYWRALTSLETPLLSLTRRLVSSA